MKRTLITGVFALSTLIFTQCRSDDENGNGGNGFGNAADPINNVETSPDLFGAIINSGDVLAKSVTAESILRYAKLYESAEKLFLIHIPSEGTDLHNVDYNRLEVLFPPLASPTDFYINENVFQPSSPENISFFENLAPIETAIAGVNHIARVRGDSVIVNARVEFFDNINRRQFFVASYLCAELPAENFEPGVADFTVPTINNFLSNADDASIFINDFPNDSLIIFETNEKYIHRYVVIGEPETPLGVALGEVNLFGLEFSSRDVLGTSQTPIRMALPKTHPIAEYATGYGIWTVMYEYEEEVDPDDPNGPPLIEITMINSRFSTID